MLTYLLEYEWNIFERTQNNGGERRRFNIKSFCANAVFIICMYYFSSVKNLLFKNAGRWKNLDSWKSDLGADIGSVTY